MNNSTPAPEALQAFANRYKYDPADPTVMLDLAIYRAGWTDALCADGWVSVVERLPEPGKAVLLDIGERHPVRAMYAEKHTLQAGDDMPEDFCEYSEEDDEYYAPEGWYEWNSQSDVFWRLHNPVRWHELPALPPAPKAAEAKGGVE